MPETIVLATFATMLAAGTFLQVPLVATLVAGYVLFAGYARWRGCSLREVARMSVSGLATVRGILVLFVVIGMMCAAWRAAGTIPYIAAVASRVVTPATFLLATFLLCCLVSMLMGTAFGTAATMGVICMTIGSVLGVSRLLCGGAILAGCYFGDRCSPLSTSAMLVSSLTKTDVFSNVGRMLRTGALPFMLTCVIYLALGSGQGNAAILDVAALFRGSINLDWTCCLPAVAIVVLAAARVKVRTTMAVSLAIAAVLCVAVQGVPVADLPGMLVFGYVAPDRALATMLDGGGILSMANTAAVICVSSTYAGLFEGTGLLTSLCDQVARLSRRSTPYFGVLATGLVSVCVSCNQTLAIMLTSQVCEGSEKSGAALALDIENSVVLVSALVPWSVSSLACLEFVGAPTASIACACFLYLLPLWTLALSVAVRREPRLADRRAGHVLGIVPGDGQGLSAAA